ncbi:FAD-dependent monooxygenase [Arthrobacter sp. B6]|uniref:FAD-dependent monooxygenase n=1 Tax=Arthrobacter sp. B6 TaxID=1570137 RepID=UPI0008366C6D|nr:FAD-dependent monooxygenase [Arthrobacter sp. B6]
MTTIESSTDVFAGLGRPDVNVDVLVIGAGPAGLTASLALARDGVSALTVTKYPGTANSPRAHITNQRTMEVLRDLGVEEQVRAVAVPNELMGHNVWATSFAGQEIARLMTWGSGVERHHEYQKASPSEMCNIPQHILEPELRDAALDQGADIRFSSEMVGIRQDDDGVDVVVQDRDSGARQLVRAKYVIAADGGRSRAAELLDFPFRGESNLGAAVSVWIEADLTKYTEHRPGTLYWMTQPGNDYWVGSGTWICVKPWTEWVLLFMYDPAEGEPDLSEEALRARAHTTIGDPDIDVRIKSVGTWQINHVVAERYSIGRVFLAGDAAHRHPPANGLGTNTSIQDAYNLCWKLKMVLEGVAGTELLETYHLERQPIGEQVVDRAMKSVADMLPISQAIGVEPGQSPEEGWARLHHLFSSEEGAPERRRKLDEAIQLQNYQFNALGVEIDQRYQHGALVNDGEPWDEGSVDPELHHRPTTHAGARLPHAWIEHKRTRLSTLDIGASQFRLFTGRTGQMWIDAAARAGKAIGIDVPVFQLGRSCEYDDVYLSWEKVREVGDDGVILVRPDGHVAWRAHKMPVDPEAELTAALAATLAVDVND